MTKYWGRGRWGDWSRTLIQCSLSGTPTFSNTSSLSFRFRFPGLRFTRTHFATWSSKATGHFKHRTTGPQRPPLGVRKKRSTASPDLAFLGFTWGSHRLPQGHPEAASTLQALGCCGEPRPWPSLRPLPQSVAAWPPPHRCAQEAPDEGHLTHRCRAPPPADPGSVPGMQRGTHGPGRQGGSAWTARRPHSPRRSLAARARTPPGPGAPSAAAAGEGTRSSLSREPPQPPSPAPHQLGALTPTSPAVGEGESRAPEPALRAVAPPPQRKAAGARGPQHLRRRAGGGRRRRAGRTGSGAGGGHRALSQGREPPALKVWAAAPPPQGRLRPHPRRRAGVFCVLFANIFLLRARAAISLAFSRPRRARHAFSPAARDLGYPRKGLLGRGGSRVRTAGRRKA